jgi:oxygen-independent coproporphyrinogen-3 oxidase
LYDALSAGKINLPCEKTDREMYHTARKLLSEAKYIHYELSNFAKEGYESRHNINCWRRVPYRGFGLGAHSFYEETRRRNTENIEDYIENLHSPQIAEKLTEADVRTETMILGLRLMEGIHKNNIPHIFSEEVAEQIKKGLLVLENDFVKLTPLGMDLANHVFCAFM